jgi:hypothetical protein
VVSALPLVGNDGLVGELLRGLREGIFFGVATRVPYMITSLFREYLFMDATSQPRSLSSNLTFLIPQVWDHGWILARICVLYKLSEKGLGRFGSLVSGAPLTKEPKEWHTFIAGMIASNLVFNYDVFPVNVRRGRARPGQTDSLKTQMNMGIGIRCMYAVCIYLVRNKRIPFVQNTYEGRRFGENIWFTVMWGFVMWHWKHGEAHAPDYKTIKNQIKSMDSIYTRGDRPVLSNWTYKNYLYWLGALMLYYKVFGDRPSIGGQLDGETRQDIVGSLERVKSTLVEYEKGLYQLE